MRGGSKQSAKTLVTCVLILACIAGLFRPGEPGELRRALLKQYWGQIQSLRIERCGHRPGLCEGSIVLAERQGTSVVLSIRPGTWIKRGDRLVILEDLEVGQEVHVQAVEVTGEEALQAATIDIASTP